MPKLKPLEQFVCDTCGGTVETDGAWLEWIVPGGRGAHSFRIVHHQRRCHQHTDHPNRADNHLHYFLGLEGLQKFLAMLDAGPVLDPKGTGIKTPPDMRSFVDTLRRLQIPYYEEARQYFGRAAAEGTDENEYAVFMPDRCKAMIERYE